MICRSCVHEEVCKHTSTIKNLETYIKSIKVSDPANVVIQCEEYLPHGMPATIVLKENQIVASSK